MEDHFCTKYMIDGEWQEAIDDNTTNICLYCGFYNCNLDICNDCCHFKKEVHQIKAQL